MLGKLYKHELIATSRQMLPLYGIALLLALISGFSMRGSAATNATRNTTMMSGLLTVLLVIVLMVIFVMTFVVCIRRFYHHVFKQEGYLTNTLPVKPWELIFTKSTVSLLWYLLSFVVVFLTVYLMMVSAVGFEALKDVTFEVILREIENALRRILGLNLDLKEYFLWALLSFVATYMASILLIYMSFSIAQLPVFAKWRVAVAVLLFFLIQYIPVAAIKDVITDMAAENAFSVQAGLITSMQYEIVLNIVLFVVYFVVTNYIMSNKLNLES